MRYLWFLALLLCSRVAYSSPGDPQQCLSLLKDTVTAESVFASAYVDPAVYQNAQCEWNAARLLARFASYNLDLTGAKVLYLRGPFGMTAQFQRNPLAEWPYHVIVVHEDKVYDLDFGREPKVLSLGDYLTRNLAGESIRGNPNSLQRFLFLHQFVEVPAEVFLEHFPKNANADVVGYEAFARKVAELSPQRFDVLWTRAGLPR